MCYSPPIGRTSIRCTPLSPILTEPQTEQTLTKDEQSAHRLEPEKQGARSALNTGRIVLGGRKGDTGALIRERKTKKSVPETEDGHGFLRWGDGFLSFFLKVPAD